VDVGPVEAPRGGKGNWGGPVEWCMDEEGGGFGRPAWHATGEGGRQ
jgi:hypothetical protein